MCLASPILYVERPCTTHHPGSSEQGLAAWTLSISDILGSVQGEITPDRALSHCPAGLWSLRAVHVKH
jgi:hypothetical protein